MNNENKSLGKVLKQQRVMIPLTLQELARASGVSPSHLGRIETGQRFPSARILLKIANPLGLNQDELLTLAGYRSPRSPTQVDSSGGRLDTYVAAVLSQEPVEIQRGVIAVLTILKDMAKGK